MLTKRSQDQSGHDAFLDPQLRKPLFHRQHAPRRQLFTHEDLHRCYQFPTHPCAETTWLKHLDRVKNMAEFNGPRAPPRSRERNHDDTYREAIGAHNIGKSRSRKDLLLQIISISRVAVLQCGARQCLISHQVCRRRCRSSWSCQSLCCRSQNSGRTPETAFR